jgi:hypothetical protein
VHPDESKPLIFIVDDEPDIRLLIEVCLSVKDVASRGFLIGILWTDPERPNRIYPFGRMMPVMNVRGL